MVETSTAEATHVTSPDTVDTTNPARLSTDETSTAEAVPMTSQETCSCPESVQATSSSQTEPVLKTSGKLCPLNKFLYLSLVLYIVRFGAYILTARR